MRISREIAAEFRSTICKPLLYLLHEAAEENLMVPVDREQSGA
jgi:hypothetical protein